MSNVTRLPSPGEATGPALAFGQPSCPPPLPPAPLSPPPLASTGTGDLIALPFVVAAAPAVEEETPVLRVVPRPRNRAARAPFVTLVLLLLGGGLVSLLLINTALSQGAFAVQNLQRANLTLTEQQQELNRSLADADQPQSLADKAVQLGMVPGGPPAFLHLPDGKVQGTPVVATSPPPPAPPAPTTTAAATTAPATTAPATSAPATTAPATTAPANTAPATTAPATTAPVAGHTSAPAVHPTTATTGKAQATGTTAPHTPNAGHTTPSKGKP